MSTFTDLEKDAASVDGFVNENGLIPTRRNGPKPSYQYLVDEIRKSRGFRVVGTFADGFTYELFNDVGIDADGNSWIYVGAGAPNKVVSAGTVPSVGAGYAQVVFNAASNVKFSDTTSVQDFKDNLSAADVENINGGNTQDFIDEVSARKLTEVVGNAALQDLLNLQLSTPVLASGVDNSSNLVFPPTFNYSGSIINEVKLSDNFQAGVRAELPVSFPFRMLPPCVSVAHGKVELLGWDASQFDPVKNEDPANFTTLYVDNINGDNKQKSPNETLDNDGQDPNFPLRSINRAIDNIAALSPQKALLLIKGGYYYDIDGFSGRTAPDTDLSIKQWFNGVDVRDSSRVIVTTETPNLSWSLVSGNVYSANRSAVQWVVDETIVNSVGDWEYYVKTSSLAECQSTEGSFYIDGNDVMVHRIGGGIPDHSIHCYTSKVNFVSTDGNYNLYVEGIDFYGGSKSVSLDSRPVTTGEKCFFKDCRFSYSGGNGVESYGIPLTIFQDCVSSYTLNDGFNYHSNRDTLTQVCNAIEINCKSYMNGMPWSDVVDINNGSTCHDSNNLIRLGGSYQKAQGPVVADVNQCNTYNFCCSAYESTRIGDTPRKAGFLASGAAQWLDMCSSKNSLYSIDVYSGGVVYVKGGVDITGNIEGMGSVVNY